MGRAGRWPTKKPSSCRRRKRARFCPSLRILHVYTRAGRPYKLDDRRCSNVTPSSLKLVVKPMQITARQSSLSLSLLRGRGERGVDVEPRAGFVLSNYVLRGRRKGGGWKSLTKFSRINAILLPPATCLSTRISQVS